MTIEELKISIKESGLKKKWIANKIGVSSVFLSYCLNGKKKLPKDREEQIVKLLKLN